jgi:cysteinyl-tRNA synthetase
VPFEEQNLIDKHHSEFLKYMSNDLKTTYVLDRCFMELLKAINSSLNDLKVWWSLVLPSSKVLVF